MRITLAILISMLTLNSCKTTGDSKSNVEQYGSYDEEPGAGKENSFFCEPFSSPGYTVRIFATFFPEDQMLDMEVRHGAQRKLPTELTKEKFTLKRSKEHIRGNEFEKMYNFVTDQGIKNKFGKTMSVIFSTDLWLGSQNIRNGFRFIPAAIFEDSISSGEIKYKSLNCKIATSQEAEKLFTKGI